MQTSQITISSPVGPLTLAANETGLTELLFGRHGVDKGSSPFIDQTIAELEEYFEGRRLSFTMPMSPAGTEFQRRVWRELMNIPFGVTISYGELAERIGNKNASRAVGLANGQNPIAIIAPCHRVIGKNGKLVGYGGGLSIKTALLDFESAVLVTGPQEFPELGG